MKFFLREWKKILILISLCNCSRGDQKLTRAIHSIWNGIKKYNIDAYDIPLVHRPFSEIPGDAVSEGVGYGMLAALYLDDQPYFDKIWSAGEKYMWNGKWYDWRVDEFGNRIGNGAATDAEQDIAFSLLQASKKIELGYWNANTTPVSYRQRGVDIINNMWDYKMIDPDTFDIAPGAGWGGKDFVNVGYFSPAWYRVFQKYDPKHNWTKVIDRGYDVLRKSPGYSLGLVPDWMTPDGQYLSDHGLGYNAYGNGRYLYKDAIRVFWRIGLDYIWNPIEDRAQSFIKNAYEFIRNRRPDFFDMNGELLPKDDQWFFNNGHSHRSRREYSALTVGMWSIVPKAFKNESLFLPDLLSFHKNPDQLFWGYSEDYFDGNGRPNPHNELYFEQFLGLFGAFILNGNFTNII